MLDSNPREVVKWPLETIAFVQSLVWSHAHSSHLFQTLEHLHIVIVALFSKGQ